MSGNPFPFFITTKDDVKLDTIYVEQEGANHTIVLWGGMLGGREGQSHMAVVLREHGLVNILLVSRRGQSASEGSNIKSGELGVFYDTQVWKQD